MTRFDATDWPILSAHFDRLLSLTEAAQATYLHDLEREQPGIAAQLRRLMSTNEERGFAHFLNDVPPIVAAPLPNQRLGPYALDEQIDQGGMGAVWRGHRADGRYEGHVAIKLLNASLVGRPAEQRFLREGSVLAKLRHPNIAYLMDAGVAPNGQPYLVLELVHGTRIDEYCESHALTTRARVRLFLPVLAAMAHAHNHLVIHRDIKPGNILVSDEGVVKLLDFGIAGLLLPAGEDPASPRTLDALTALTPEFAAPEQLLDQPLTTATDVYALGLVLFVLLAGRQAHTDTEDSLLQRMRTRVDTEAPRMSHAAATPGMARLLRGDLDNIVAKALRLDPQQRYVTVDAFADDLRRFLADEPVKARADSLLYRTTKFVARHRGSVLSGMVVLLALLLTGGLAIQQMFEARAQRDAAITEDRRLSAQSELTEFLLGDSLGQASQDAVQLRLERARELIRRRFRDDPLIQARLLLNLSGRYIDIGDVAASTSLTSEAQSIAQRIDDPQLNADIACGRAQDFISTRDLVAAQQQAANGYRNMQRLRRVPSGLLAECAQATAMIAQQQGDHARATSVLRNALHALEQDGITRSPRYTSIANDYALSLVKAGDYRHAWEAEQRALAIVKDTGRDDSVGYFAMVNVAATALIRGGQPRRAMGWIDTMTSNARGSAPGWKPPFYLDGSRLVAQVASGSQHKLEGDLDGLAERAQTSGWASLEWLYRTMAMESALNRGDLPAAQAQAASLATPGNKLFADPALQHEAVLLLLVRARLALAQRHSEDTAVLLKQAVAQSPGTNRPADTDALRVLLLQSELASITGSYDAAEHFAQQALALAQTQSIDAQSSASIGTALLWRARSEAGLGNRAASAATARAALPHLTANLDSLNPLIADARALVCLDNSVTGCSETR